MTNFSHCVDLYHTGSDTGMCVIWNIFVLCCCLVAMLVRLYCFCKAKLEVAEVRVCVHWNSMILDIALNCYVYRMHLVLISG